VQRKNETASHFRERVRRFQNRVRPTLDDEPRYHRRLAAVAGAAARRPPQIRKITGSQWQQRPFYLPPYGDRIYSEGPYKPLTCPSYSPCFKEHKAQHPARHS
jgi:hypothetical protein